MIKDLLWDLAEKLKKHFWCRYFHRRNLCWPKTWGRGLAGPWHCGRCHPCGEVFDLLAGKPLRGVLGDRYVDLRR